MKRRILAVLLIFSMLFSLLPVAALAADPETGDPYPNQKEKWKYTVQVDGAGADIRDLAATPVIDMGEVEYGGTGGIRRTLTFTNVSGEAPVNKGVGRDIHITFSEGALHYFDAAWQSGDGELAPGESATLVLTVKPDAEIPVTRGGQTSEILLFMEQESRLGWPVEIAVQVSPKPVTLTSAGVIEKDYGQELDLSRIPCEVKDQSGAATGLTLADLGITLTGAGADKTAKVGEYECAISGGNGNYAVTLDVSKVKVRVNPAEPKLDWISTTNIYSGQTLSKSVISGQYRNPYTGEVVEGDFAWVDGSQKLVSGSGQMRVVERKDYTFTPKDSNHKAVRGTADVVISPNRAANVTLSTDAKLDVTYDGEAHPVSFSVSGEAIPESVKQSLTVEYRRANSKDAAWTTNAPVDAGTYDVRASLSGSSYEGSASAVLTIRQREIHISQAQNYLPYAVSQKTYDGGTAFDVNEAYVVPINVLKADKDQVQVSFKTEGTFSDAGAGKKDAVIRVYDVQLSGAKAANYTMPEQTVSIRQGANSWISPRKINIRANAVYKHYGQTMEFADSDFTVNTDRLPQASSGMVNGDTILDLQAVLMSEGTAATADAGTYSITAAVNNPNYDCANASNVGTLTVQKTTPEMVSVSAGKGKIGNDISTVSLTGTYLNPYNDAAVNGYLRWTETRAVTSIGVYSYEFVPYDSRNYETVSGTVQVEGTDKEVVHAVVEGDTSFTYDGQPHPIQASTTGSALDIAVNFRIEYKASGSGEAWSTNAPVEVGYYDVKITAEPVDAINYEGDTIETVMVISPAFLDAVEVHTIGAGATLDQIGLDGTVIRAAAPSSAHVSAIGGNETVSGTFHWNKLGGVTDPHDVPVVYGVEYQWTFLPNDTHNYQTLIGSTAVEEATAEEQAPGENQADPGELPDIMPDDTVNLPGDNSGSSSAPGGNGSGGSVSGGESGGIGGSTAARDGIRATSPDPDVAVSKSALERTLLDAVKDALSENQDVTLVGDGSASLRVSARRDGAELKAFDDPLTVTIPVSQSMLDGIDPAKLTLAKVSVGADGEITLTYMGGKYDPAAGVFRAYVDEPGDYILVAADNLTLIDLHIGSLVSEVNGQERRNDVAPYIIQNRTMVPVRFVSETLGAKVDWNAKARLVTIQIDGATLQMTIDQEIPGFGAAPVIRDGRTLVPIRYISEALGANVIYVPAAQEVVIAK